MMTLLRKALNNPGVAFRETRFMGKGEVISGLVQTDGERDSVQGRIFGLKGGSSCVDQGR